MQGEFLDPELPTKPENITAALKDLDKTTRNQTIQATRLKKIRFSKNIEEPTKEEVELDNQIEAADEMRDRLQTQLTNAKAGTKVVSRLEATGVARQIVPDEEHRLSTPPSRRQSLTAALSRHERV